MPNAWQEVDAFLPLLILMTLGGYRVIGLGFLFGVFVNRGGTEERKEKTRFYLSSLRSS